MRVPAARDWLFSLKAFAAAMLALWIALRFGLPRPYWTMTAVYVVANPLSGATVSKAFDRVFGTLLGAAAAVALVPQFVDSPELLMFAIALWTGTLLYIALHDRTPRNYTFLLAGYTLPLLALPTVDSPSSIFTIGASRSEEIIIGIISASLIGTTIFPASSVQVLSTRIETWMKEIASWADDVLTGKKSPLEAAKARQRLVAEITPLNAVISQLGHDPDAREVRHLALELRRRLLFLLPLLSSISDRLHAVKVIGGELDVPLTNTLGRIAAWIKLPLTLSSTDTSEQLVQLLSSHEADGSALNPWDAALHSSLLLRLQELVMIWRDCRTLATYLQQGRYVHRASLDLRFEPPIAGQPYRDYGLLLFSTCSTALATFVAGSLWIWSGWSDGANFTMFVAIACCFFANLDRPAVAMRVMLIWTAVAYVGTGIYIFGILPRINDFTLLAMILAPPFLLVGAFIPRPELSLITLLLAANTAGDLGIDGRYAGDFVSYANGGVSIVLGLFFSILWTVLVRPFGTELIAQRLLRAGWADLARLAGGQQTADHRSHTSINLDRLAQLSPRIANLPEHDLFSFDGLAELRIGLNIVTLRQIQLRLPPRTQIKIDEVLRGAARFFCSRLRSNQSSTPGAELLANIDDLLTSLFRSKPSASNRLAIDSLVGLRRALYPHTPSPREDAAPAHEAPNFFPVPAGGQ